MSGEEQHFISEDENAGYASPVMDIVAALALTALAVWIMVESLALKVPQGIATAPGLLPFIIAAMLAAMAVALGLLAWRRMADGMDVMAAGEAGDAGRTVLLVAILVVYVVALEVLAFSTDISVGGFNITVGGFEVVSIIVLSTVFRIFWTDRIWLCAAVAAGWIIVLSLTFKNVFEIPLPGSA